MYKISFALAKMNKLVENILTYSDIPNKMRDNVFERFSSQKCLYNTEVPCKLTVKYWIKAIKPSEGVGSWLVNGSIGSKNLILYLDYQILRTALLRSKLSLTIISLTLDLVV